MLFGIQTTSSLLRYVKLSSWTERKICIKDIQVSHIKFIMSRAIVQERHFSSPQEYAVIYILKKTLFSCHWKKCKWFYSLLHEFAFQWSFWQWSTVLNTNNSFCRPYLALSAFHERVDPQFVALINPFWLKFNPASANAHYIYGIIHSCIMSIGLIGNALVIFMFIRLVLYI